MTAIAPRSWSESELDYLREHYSRQTVFATAVALNRTERSVAVKAHKLGLRAGGREDYAPETTLDQQLLDELHRLRRETAALRERVDEFERAGARFGGVTSW